VRLIGATNADLGLEIREGRFRADLYYRLSILEIPVPPLRERGDDIPLLARAFAKEVATRMGRPTPELDPETASRLMAYPWPGNVRELRSVLERALVLHPGRGLSALDLAPEPISGGILPEAGRTGLSDLNLRENLNKVERSLLLEAHRRAQGVRRETARLLGMDPRNLAYYFHKHGLEPANLGE
jgi:DNA-binding NtrC family response regulator